MKPILIDINEMSDSRELYESRANPWFSRLIYTILTIVIIAIIWMYFGRIEVVVKSEGIIRPNSQIANVMNTYGGELETVNIEDGSIVNEGAILYTVNHDELLVELEYYNVELSDTEKKLVMLDRYKKSIEDGVNHFENTLEEDEFFIKTETYLSTYDSKKSQNTYKEQEYGFNLETINKQLQELNQNIKYTETLKASIKSNNNLFLNTGSEGEYYNKYLKYQRDYTILNKQYDTDLNVGGTQSKEELLEQNNQDRATELESFKLQYLIELDNSINTLKSNIDSLELNKKTLELQKEMNSADENGSKTNLEQYKNTELASVIDTMNTDEIKKKELEIKISKIKSQINNAVVRASRSGFINSNIELVEGNYLEAGSEVLSIIPVNDTKYKVDIHVNNQDIGKIKEGMNVKLNVYALPNTEYGYLNGTVTKISNDLKVNQNNGSTYYLVEAELDGNKLFNSRGKEAALKSGMASQAQMVTENKSILVYLLKKLDLWLEYN